MIQLAGRSYGPIVGNSSLGDAQPISTGIQTFRGGGRRDLKAPAFSKATRQR